MKEEYLFLPFDCCIVAVFKESYGSEFVRRMDFKHHLYHTLVVPKEQCQYIIGDINFTDENPPELFKYKKIIIHDLREKLFSTVTPLFLTLEEEHVIDILTDKISIYIHFDPDRFYEMCEERGLKPNWISFKELKMTHDEAKMLPSFDGRYLKISNNKTSSFFGYGFFLKILYDFQSGYNVIEQIKEELWLRSNPRLGKIRFSLYKKRDKFLFMSKFYFKKILNRIK